MTINDFINIGKIQTKMNSYKSKKKKAIEICCDVFEKYKNPYIALSGGKDSAAMCFIVDEAARICGKNYRIWSHLSDASFPGTKEICTEIAERLNQPIDLYECPFSAFEAIKNPQKQAFGKTGTYFDTVRQYAADKDLCFVGVRAGESKRRHKSAMVHGQVFYSKSMGDCTVCHPLLWFNLYDIAAAMYEYNVPIHPIYYKTSIDLGKNSEGEERFIRLSYITSRDLLNKGTALFLKINYPNEYCKLAEVYPEIRRWT